MVHHRPGRIRFRFRPASRRDASFFEDGELPPLRKPRSGRPARIITRAEEKASNAAWARAALHHKFRGKPTWTEATGLGLYGALFLLLVGRQVPNGPQEGLPLAEPKASLFALRGGADPAIQLAEASLPVDAGGDGPEPGQFGGDAAPLPRVAQGTGGTVAPALASVEAPVLTGEMVDVAVLRSAADRGEAARPLGAAVQGGVAEALGEVLPASFRAPLREATPMEAATARAEAGKAAALGARTMQAEAATKTQPAEAAPAIAKAETAPARAAEPADGAPKMAAAAAEMRMQPAASVVEPSAALKGPAPAEKSVAAKVAAPDQAKAWTAGPAEAPVEPAIRVSVVENKAPAPAKQAMDAAGMRPAGSDAAETKEAAAGVTKAGSGMATEPVKLVAATAPEVGKAALGEVKATPGKAVPSVEGVSPRDPSKLPAEASGGEKAEQVADASAGVAVPEGTAPAMPDAMNTGLDGVLPALAQPVVTDGQPGEAVADGAMTAAEGPLPGKPAWSLEGLGAALDGVLPAVAQPVATDGQPGEAAAGGTAGVAEGALPGKPAWSLDGVIPAKLEPEAASDQSGKAATDGKVAAEPAQSGKPAWSLDGVIPAKLEPEAASDQPGKAATDGKMETEGTQSGKSDGPGTALNEMIPAVPQPETASGQPGDAAGTAQAGKPGRGPEAIDGVVSAAAQPSRPTGQPGDGVKGSVAAGSADDASPGGPGAMAEAKGGLTESPGGATPAPGQWAKAAEAVAPWTSDAVGKGKPADPVASSLPEKPAAGAEAGLGKSAEAPAFTHAENSGSMAEAAQAFSRDDAVTTPTEKLFAGSDQASETHQARKGMVVKAPSDAIEVADRAGPAPVTNEAGHGASQGLAARKDGATGRDEAPQGTKLATVSALDPDQAALPVALAAADREGPSNVPAHHHDHEPVGPLGRHVTAAHPLLQAQPEAEAAHHGAEHAGFALSGMHKDLLFA